MSNMSKKIYALRKEQNKTLEDIAKIVGVGKSTVRKWETGAIANMRRDKIAKLADALNTTPAYLMGWEEKVYTKNDAITDIILRLRSDGNFLAVVQNINSLTPEQLSAAETFLSAFSKTEDN